MEQAQTEEKKKAEGRFSSELFSWGESLMAVLIFFVVVFTFFVRLIGVDGTSMNPTLQDHSIMLVSNLGYTPEKGDIVIVRKEGFMARPADCQARDCNRRRHGGYRSGNR